MARFQCRRPRRQPVRSRRQAFRQPASVSVGVLQGVASLVAARLWRDRCVEDEEHDEAG